jgi:gliding motility-associated lipoprotein GldH
MKTERMLKSLPIEKLVTAFFFVSFSVLIGCDAQRVYETNRDFEDTHWPARDTAIFIFSIADTTPRYNIILNLRNSINFETARLFLNYSLTDSTSVPLRSRLIEHNLFDRKTGEPFGESGLGNIYGQKILIEPNIKFSRKGRYVVKLTHMMRVDTLQELLSIGVRVEKASF